METFCALLAICAVPGEFPAQRPVTRSFLVFLDLHLNKPLSKQSWGWWFQTPSRPLWRHCNVYVSGVISSAQNLSLTIDMDDQWNITESSSNMTSSTPQPSPPVVTNRFYTYQSFAVSVDEYGKTCEAHFRTVAPGYVRSHSLLAVNEGNPPVISGFPTQRASNLRL